MKTYKEFNVEKYIGIKTKIRGRTLEEGIDCWGLILLVLDDIYGIKVPDPMYNTDELESCTDIDPFSEDSITVMDNGNIYKHDITDWVYPVSINEISFGDLIIMRSYSIYKIGSHIGICVGKNEMLHTGIPSVCKLSINRIKPFITGVYRIKDDYR